MGNNDTPLVLTADQKALLAEKQTLVHEYALVQQGQFDKATFLANWDTFKQKHHLGHGAQSANDVSPNVCPQITAAACIHPSGLLNIPQEPQYKPYYCGPAAVEEMLLGMGHTTGPHGENLNAATFPNTGQVALGNGNNLHTDANGGTNWGDSSVPNTLNAWIHSSFYVPIAASSMSITSYEDNITYDIDNSYPVAAGIHEDTSTPHLSGHTGPYLTTINHWIAIKGYTAYGGNTTYNDSIHGVPTGWGWPTVPAASTLSSKIYILPLIQPYGIVA